MEDSSDTRTSRATSRAPSGVSSTTDKVTKRDFSPETRRLATHSKEKVRELVATVSAFPSDKDAFVWGAIQEAAKNDVSFKNTLSHVSKDLEVKEQLLVYVSNP